jgi:hypothetical protein
MALFVVLNACAAKLVELSKVTALRIGVSTEQEVLEAFGKRAPANPLPRWGGQSSTPRGASARPIQSKLQD